MKIIKYTGNAKYVVGLARNEEKKYIFFANIDTISLKQHEEDMEIAPHNMRFAFSKEFIIEILLKIGSDNSFMHFLEIESEKEYETIMKFLEFIL